MILQGRKKGRGSIIDYELMPRELAQIVLRRGCHRSLNDAIALQFGDKLVVRYDRLYTALGNRG